MITRDPLKIPVLEDNYWATFDQVNGRELADTINLVNEHALTAELMQVSDLPGEKQLETGKHE